MRSRNRHRALQMVETELCWCCRCSPSVLENQGGGTRPLSTNLPTNTESQKMVQYAAPKIELQQPLASKVFPWGCLETTLGEHC